MQLQFPQSLARRYPHGAPACLQDEDGASNSTAPDQVLAGQGAVIAHHQHVHLETLSLGLLDSQPKVQAVPCGQKGRTLCKWRQGPASAAAVACSTASRRSPAANRVGHGVS